MLTIIRTHKIVNKQGTERSEQYQDTNIISRNFSELIEISKVQEADALRISEKKVQNTPQLMFAIQLN